MKLTYRGVSYNYNPPTVEMTESKLVGTYRGLDIRFRNPIKVPVQQPTLDLIYRGRAYTANAIAEDAIARATTPAVDAAPVTAPVAAPAPVLASSLEDKARSAMMNHTRFIKRRQQVMLSRLDEEVGLTAKDAAHYWNRIQGKVHPTFRATYDRNRVAFS